MNDTVERVERPEIVTDGHLFYLDNLRESGVTNMFGAGPYLQENFGFNRADAKTVTLAYVLEGLGCD